MKKSSTLSEQKRLANIIEQLFRTFGDFRCTPDEVVMACVTCVTMAKAAEKTGSAGGPEYMKEVENIMNETQTNLDLLHLNSSLKKENAQ